MKGKLHHKHGIFGSTPILLLQDGRITEKALRVWIALSSFEGTKAESYPGIDEIGKRAGVARSSVSEATRLLVDAGWLKKKRRGLGKSNVYECLSYSAPTREFQAEKRERNQPKELSGRFSEIRESRKSGNPSVTEQTKRPFQKTTGGRSPPQFPPKGTCLAFQRVRRKLDKHARLAFPSGRPKPPSFITVLEIALRL
jgi:DNA-binding MarR family transcriptional regulator